ncbi:clotting factor B-like [Macrobrachium nipponense]|uniref:clotting factor B-like n=1 Tax=Macrobrachium nipponense TaxID=159736 RepID=UPI0030C8607D
MDFLFCEPEVIFTDPFESGGPTGSPCIAKGGGRGQCTEISECPGIRDTFRTNPPANCGFNGNSPIVCCPVEEAASGDSALDISTPSSSSITTCGRSAVKFIFPRFRRAKELLKEFAAPPDITARPPVVGGFESQRNAWPWMALIGIKKEDGFDWFC